MKRNMLLAVGALALILCLGPSLFSTAQEKVPAQRYECALIKWDGTDKVCVNLPDKSEILHVFQLSSTRTPKEMQDEEFCLAYICNKLAKEGWELVNLDSRRILLRRPLSH
jgi:hypothetical protein